ncbi:MAG: D-erythronate dehydrogenase, partial [Cyclobacteriaceae bacterium]
IFNYKKFNVFSMRVIILGGGGFIGSRLARTLIKSGGLSQGAVSHLTLVDLAFPDDILQNTRMECLQEDFSEVEVMNKLLRQKPDIIFHLAAVVSGEAEKNFELGMKVNFHASLQMLELCREIDFKPRIVFASSCGVFGGDVTQTITEETDPKPRSSYGTQKAMVELLVRDYSRREFIDGRSIRLPTITVRPGKPNAATSSFLSGIIREPLNGVKATYPVPPETPFWILSPKRVVQNFIHAANIDDKALGNDRTINLPGITVSVQDMIDSLKKIAGPEITGLISHQPDAFLESIVLTWPPHFDPQMAIDLGFVGDSSVDEIIQSYIEEEDITVK